MAVPGGAAGGFLGLILLRLLPAGPAVVSWLDESEKKWIHDELARDAALIGPPARDSLLSALLNPKVLLLVLIGLLGNGAGISLALSAPAVLASGAGLDTRQIGNVVRAGECLAFFLCFLPVGTRTGEAIACETDPFTRLWLRVVCS